MQAATYLVMPVITMINLNYLCLADPVLMCYYPSTARHMGYIAKFEIKDINFTLCTHYIYLSARIDNVSKTMVASDLQAEEGPNGLYRQFVDAKYNFTSIKTLLSVRDDAGLSYSQFKVIGENNAILSNFVASVVAFLRKHGFDGLEIDSPHVVNGSKIAHSNLLKALREKFDEDTNNRLILAARCPGLEIYIYSGYDVVSIATSVDYAIISTHQLFVYEWQLAQFPSPLFSSRTVPPYSSQCVNASLNGWNRRGMPFNKMVVGFTGAGRMRELANKSDYQPWAPVVQTYHYGHYFMKGYNLTYIENCLDYNRSTKYYDNVQKSPYMINNYLWIGYDDGESLDLKIEWVMKFGVAGVMFFSLDDDDFHGTWCGKGKFPLVTAMKNTMTRILPDKDKDQKDKDGKDNVLTYTTEKYNTITTEKYSNTTTEKDSNITSAYDSKLMRNLLYGFLIVLIPIVCLAMFFLYRRRRRQKGEE